MSAPSLSADVVIVGSGPVGSTFARALVVECGRSVLMLEAGAQLSARAGENLRNSVYYQQNMDKFSMVIQAQLQAASIPTASGASNAASDDVTSTGHADANAKQSGLYKCFLQNNHNPEQDPRLNLDGAAVTYAVGGMATHWFCNTPRHHPDMERSKVIADEEWDTLYDEAEALLRTSRAHFTDSVRNTLIREQLLEEYSELSGQAAPQHNPIAGYRSQQNPDHMHWTGSDDILGPLLEDHTCLSRFDLRSQNLVERLVLSSDGNSVDHAVVRDLQRDQVFCVRAQHYVVAGGAILTPQLLFNSGIRPKALGRYLTWHQVASTRVTLKQALIDKARNDDRFTTVVKDHQQRYPSDPLPIRFSDPDPQLCMPVSKDRPWHSVVSLVPLGFTADNSHIDKRTLVDLHWFGRTTPSSENYVSFSEKTQDSIRMPQPTFNVSLSDEDKTVGEAMLTDMTRAEQCLGDALPGFEPRMFPHGTDLHMTGTVRMGRQDDGTSVTDPYGRVWGLNNLWLGGNGLIPTATASNPTLTSVAMALRSARRLYQTTPP